MIPAGYAACLIAWATRPDLTDDQQTARKTQLLDEFEALVTGQIDGGKPRRTLLSGSANGKSFTWAISITREEKMELLRGVLTDFGLLSADAAPIRVTYAGFSGIER